MYDKETADKLEDDVFNAIVDFSRERMRVSQVMDGLPLECDIRSYTSGYADCLLDIVEHIVMLAYPASAFSNAYDAKAIHAMHTISLMNKLSERVSRAAVEHDKHKWDLPKA
jgi:hypothetical protein